MPQRMSPGVVVREVVVMMEAIVIDAVANEAQRVLERVLEEDDGTAAGS